MAQVKLLKIDSDGVNVEMDIANDEVTFASYSVNDPTTEGLFQTAGEAAFDDLMIKDGQNTMTSAGGITFPDGITDAAGEVDAFKLPSIAGAPTATPTLGTEGHLVWDSTNDKLYAWDGSAWKDLSIVNEAGLVCNVYTADEALAANDAVYISAADNVSKADVSAGGAPSRVIGFADAAAIDTASVNVCSEGVLGGFSGLTAGSRYYADPGTAGLITATRPTGSGNTIVQVGYAKSATELHIHIEQLGRLA